MTAGKIAISLPQAQIDAARQAVQEGRAARVSAYVSEALPQREQDDSLASLVAEWMAEDGSPFAADYAWADACSVSRPARRRRERHAGCWGTPRHRAC